MNRFIRGNLKTRLALLILAAITPAFALSVFTSYKQMNTQMESVRDATLRLVRVMKASHLQSIDDAKGVLGAMSQLASLRPPGSQRCALVQDELAQKFPGYKQIGLADLEGTVACSTDPSRLGTNVSGLPFFRDILTRRDIGLGPYQYDEHDVAPRVYMGTAVTGLDRRIEGVIFAALELSHFATLPPAAQMSGESIFVVFDDSGLVLARYPDPQGWTGTREIARAPLVRHVRGSLAEEGVIDLMGADGVQRLFSYARIHRAARQSVFLATGIPVATAYAGARAAMRTNMVILGIVFVLVLGIAWVGSQRLIVRKLQSLIRATDRIRKGDFSARAGVSRTEDQVGQLAVAIDAMAASIESRVADLQRHGAELRELKEMNDALQACITQDEVLAVVRQFALRLFPGQPGALYLLHPSGDYLEAKACWEQPAAKPEFLLEDCWAARRGKTYRVQADTNQPRCRHVYEPPPNNYVCVPLIVQGEMLGVLHLENDLLAAQDGQRGSGDQALKQAAAEHVGLTLANLRLQETLHAQAMRDGLTGLFNRRFMEESLRRETANARRNRSCLTIIMIDIDHFKRYNDTYGHAAGDALLREVGRMLQTEMRSGDLACRYGGEEFTVILPATSLANGAAIAETLRQGCPRLQLAADERRLTPVTISLGVACFPLHGESWEEVLHAADMALMQAKQTRNRAIVYGSDEGGTQQERA